MYPCIEETSRWAALYFVAYFSLNVTLLLNVLQGIVIDAYTLGRERQEAAEQEVKTMENTLGRRMSVADGLEIDRPPRVEGGGSVTSPPFGPSDPGSAKPSKLQMMRDVGGSALSLGSAGSQTPLLGGQSDRVGTLRDIEARLNMRAANVSARPGSQASSASTSMFSRLAVEDLAAVEEVHLTPEECAELENAVTVSTVTGTALKGSTYSGQGIM